MTCLNSKRNFYSVDTVKLLYETGTIVRQYDGIGLGSLGWSWKHFECKYVGLNFLGLKNNIDRRIKSVKLFAQLK